MKIYIDGVGHRNNGPEYHLDDTVQAFMGEVKRGMYRLRHEGGDSRLKISLDVLVKFEKPVEVEQ